MIDYDYLRAHPKRLCSYSDGTFVLSAVWSGAPALLTTYYGMAPGAFSDLREYDYAETPCSTRRGSAEHAHRQHPLEPLDRRARAGRADGGGYLRNVALMLRGDYLRYDRQQKYVLFLEDHEKFGDRAYVSAMLSHIEQSGVMACVSGSAGRSLFRNGRIPSCFPACTRSWPALGHSRWFTVATISAMAAATPSLDIGRRVELNADQGTMTYLHRSSPVSSCPSSSRRARKKFVALHGAIVV